MSDLVTVTRHGGVAVVALNNPPVNALSHAVRVALIASLKALFAAADVEAIVIACEGRTFIAGADIREFGKPPLDPDLPELVEFLDGSPKATIAAIHGTALGGGLELALACHFRVATESAKLGLPEVTLGILPGAGGTQRLPRLIGVKPALDLILSGAPISAAQAQRLGLIDGIIGDRVKDAALEFASSVLAQGHARRRVSELSATLDDADTFPAYERSVAERFHGFLAPSRCLDAVRGAVELPFDQGLQLERELFKQLMASPESKAQRHAFFGEREVAKVPGLADDTPSRSVKSIAVVGTGVGFTSFATSFADARIAVTLVADTQDLLDRALSQIRESYAEAVSRGRITESECAARLERIRPTLSYDDARDADLLIECVPDELSAKQAVLARLDLIAKPSAILATSTALWSIESLAEATSRPTELVALHLVGPSEPSRLLECVRGPRTSPESFATVMKLARSLGKIAVPVSGHVARRLLARRRDETLALVEGGALPEDVDRALTEFGYPIGPFALDLERSARATPDPALAALLERHSASRGLVRRNVSLAEISARCLYGVINEAARVLDEGLAARPLDIDMIMMHGCGFPLYRGGPLFFADQIGLTEVRERLLQFREQTGNESWTPAPLIERLAAAHGSFYKGPR
ncbi:MAG TPA: 3-hydroxyacyl-CoA dehydrogenase NAD-binding domain-containing protein [Polyangiaceae bacterium]|jgi:3-hydroxyacyl-CoA dehydrogenase